MGIRGYGYLSTLSAPIATPLSSHSCKPAFYHAHSPHMFWYGHYHLTLLVPLNPTNCNHGSKPTKTGLRLMKHTSHQHCYTTLTSAVPQQPVLIGCNLPVLVARLHCSTGLPVLYTVPLYLRPGLQWTDGNMSLSE